MEIVGYIFATVFIVASFFVEQTKVPLDLFGVDPTVTLFYLGIFIFANIMLFLLVLNCVAIQLGFVLYLK